MKQNPELACTSKKPPAARRTMEAGMNDSRQTDTLATLTSQIAEITQPFSKVLMPATGGVPNFVKTVFNKPLACSHETELQIGLTRLSYP